MKRLSFLLAAMMAVACSSFEPFTFVQMSDTQIGFFDNSPRYAHSDSLMKAAVEGANALDPAYVFITGDMLNQPGNAVQDSVYRVRKAEIKAPVYEVSGNHDAIDYGRFCFRDRGCAFIGLNSNCIKDGDQAAESAQKEWLIKELADAAGSQYIFIFLHCPIIRESLEEPEDYFNFSIEKRKEYLTLFKEAGVSAVFAGHCHQEWVGDYEGIGLYTAGSVCNALGHGTPGYNVVKVTRDGFTVEYVPTPGVDPTHCRF